MRINRKILKNITLILITLTFAISQIAPIYAPVYRSHSEQINMFKTLCNEYSQASYEVIGETYEGNDIIVCKFGNPNNPAVLWDGSLHGWEDMGTETMYYLAEWLLSSSDSYATRIRQNNYVLFIPVVNVDSEVRENCNFESCSNGVDLNRNFKYGWSYSSCGTYPETFHGDSAASEPETQTIRAAMAKFRPAFYMNIHVGGEYINVDGSANSQMANDFMSLYTQYASSFGVMHYSTSLSSGGNGMAYGDAKEFGGIGLLFEMYTASSWSDKPSQSTLENTYMPRLKAILVAMCQACEGDSPSPPPEEPEPTPEEPEEPTATTSVTLRSNQGTIRYTSPQTTLNFGWCGYITSESEVIPLLNELQADGWNTVRYQSVPDWADHDGYSVSIDYDILDLLVEEADKRGMYVYLLCAHAWQPGTGEGGSGNFIDGHEQEWISDFRSIAQRYSSYDNIIIDAWSEYSSSQGESRYKSLAQMFLDDFREHGLNMIIHFNIWWNSPLFALNDPENNYAEGRHHYAGSLDNYNPSTPIDFEVACEESGINDMMFTYFEDNNNRYYQESQRLGIPYYIISEMGGSETATTAYGGHYSMSVGNVAYVMKILQMAKEKGVSCIMHRVGWLSDYDLYYQYAEQYFGETFY
jgi:hypothetical protein